MTTSNGEQAARGYEVVDIVPHGSVIGHQGRPATTTAEVNLTELMEVADAHALSRPKVGDMVFTHCEHRGHLVPIEGKASDWGFTLPLPNGGAYVVRGVLNIFDLRPCFMAAVDGFYPMDDAERLATIRRLNATLDFSS